MRDSVGLSLKCHISIHKSCRAALIQCRESGDWPVPRPHQMRTKASSPSPGLCPAFKEPPRRSLRAVAVFCCLCPTVKSVSPRSLKSP
ncbi:hypothetical protein GOA97_17985 [Sinorhizobium meliloti]|nr:hypothetical protein [Sinorhizobium meliloti]MDW9463172.1 hypothetical protein [Sinorhizobium meliloti]MDW9656361.1 hypothetical protein [Sinorhizobium meliloti]MDW9938150.1 hypothetical protein [Sinorhizobium meliloti]MDW9947523.1 hypothetical protein [Sinorhizobium meliloti]